MGIQLLAAVPGTSYLKDRLLHSNLIQMSSGNTISRSSTIREISAGPLVSLVEQESNCATPNGEKEVNSSCHSDRGKSVSASLRHYY